ncbi:MAG: radical SAM protein [Patescibacteria group bacterium]
MKILFINPWLKTLFGDDKAKPGHPHLGLAYLIAVLKKNGFTEIDIFDQGLEDNDEILFEKIKIGQPDLIAMTTFSYCFAYADELIKKIKEVTATPIILGGPHVSAVKKEVLLQTKADFAMQGEAENSFVKFLQEFVGNKNYAEVGNLFWKNSSGQIVENEREPLILDLDAIPFPDYEAFNFSRYNYFHSKTLPIITSRGCPYGCNYCSVKLSMGRGFRPRSPENVVAEMKHWINLYGITKFEVNDDCFTLDLERAEKICDLIISEKLNIKYEMYNGIRADRVSQNLLQKMKDSGCIFVSFGCESGNQEIIYNMGKALKLEKVREAVDLTNKIGIRNSVNFIIGHKGETYKTAMETVKFAKSLPTNFVNFYNVVPYPGTELFSWAIENSTYMMPVADYLGKVGSRDLTPVFETKEFTKAERIKVLKKGYALYEKTVLQFRLGKYLGFVAYLVSRNRKLFEIGRKLALSNKVGFWIYEKFSKKSRKID